MDIPLEELAPSTKKSSAQQVHRRDKSEFALHAATKTIESIEETTVAEDPSLPPVDSGSKAWIFCVSACTFETLIWGWNNTYGIFQDYYTSNPPFNRSSSAAVSTIGTASLGIQYIEIIVVISVFQRYPEYAKPAMYVSLFVCVVSLLLSSFATGQFLNSNRLNRSDHFYKLWQLVALQGVMFGLAAGVIYTPVVLWLSEWFVERRGLAGGLIFGGAGIGGLILPLVMGYLLDTVGFRWTLRIWAVVLGACCAIALKGLNPRIPIRRPTMDIPRQPWLPRDISSLKNPVLFFVTGTTIVQALGFFSVSLFIPTFTSSLSSATLPSRIVLALFNATSPLFYIIFGRMCDLYPYPYVILACGIGSALSAFVLWGFASSLSWVFAFSTIFGGLGGAFPSFWPAAASEIGGSRNQITNLAFGCFTVVRGISAIVGPIIAASLHDTSSQAKSVYGGFGFRKVEIFVGSMAVATSFGGLILLFYSQAKRKIQ
ncbi:hypothetical protein GALMADRAFT_125448 [Galerina marginata CBS 339.88]|uniref:Major facilitator superfamily (MFS) profile domain-containing protein n=1 Tax=Galerina marginata (strain CBS 339.88) TaxID=685588 RepID=A0A067SQU2_GALM3|nr:hypothetical protein GALMADRAFT_125448 [Galerina marginata CBS 339.88]